MAWTYPEGDTDFNPLVARGVVYSRARGTALVALDAATGKPLWVHDGIEGFALRGVNYWESKDGTDRRLFYSARNILRALDARTGTPIASFGTDGAVDLSKGLDRDPETVEQQSRFPGKVFENLLILGSTTNREYTSAPGDIRAVDVRTGALVWTFRTVPRAGEFGADTWPDARARHSRRRQRLGRALRRRGTRHRLRADGQRASTTSTAATGTATTCLPTASLRWMRERADGCGTSRPCTTTSGTWTTTPRRS